MSVATASWDNLPPELRYKVICYLPNGEHKLGSLASVSREWQSVLEPLNFSRISLSVPRLDDPYSQTLLFKRRKEIHYIWFRIELEEYDCNDCANSDQEQWGLSENDNQLIKDAFDKLLTTLCKWEACNDLILDISVYSPSDNQHYFKHLSFCSDSLLDLNQCALAPLDSQEKAAIHDLAHGWTAIHQAASPPHQLAIEKTFDEIMGEGPFEDEEPEMQWWRGLPAAPAVKGLLLRQQTRRRWKPVALANMFSRFHNLRELFYEPWREFTEIEWQTDERYQTLIESFQSTALQKLILFENNSELYAERYSSCPPVRIPHPRVSQRVAHLSTQLSFLSASFIVDACYFFEACKTLNTWDKLTSLALTSRILTSQGNVLEANKMLRNAAAIALKMPKLGTLELWNGRPGDAMLFRYQRDKAMHSSTVTVRGTYGLSLEDATVQAWDLVAEEQHGGDLIVQKSHLDPSLIRGHGDAICQLGLSLEVVRPVSLQQILTEHTLGT